jgi:hypothetical protein
MPIKESLSRLFEQLSEMRLQISRLRDIEGAWAARDEIDRALKGFTGSNLALLHALPVEELLSLLARGGKLDAEKGFFIAEMLRLEALLLAEPQEETCHKALLLYLEAFDEEEELAARYGAGVADVVARLESSALPADVKHRAFASVAASGDYARAEDLLFGLLASEADVVLLERGRRFYEELLGLPEDELVRGGLSRAEVEESLRELDGFGWS